MIRPINLFTWLLGIILLSGVCYADEFPYRKDYPDVSIVEIADLKAGYDDGTFLLIDVRSSIEYETIHIKRAHHSSLANNRFQAAIEKIAKQNPGKKIAVYCNGVTCLKSYVAAQIATDNDIKNVYAFDAGVYAWTKAYPSETILVGKEIVDPEKQLIPESDFLQKTIDFQEFKKLAAGDNVKVIDVRDPMQRVGKLPGVTVEALPIPMNKLIKNIINRQRFKENKLLIFDQVGKQVRWVMYHLEDKGYVNYVFLKGGATAVLQEQNYKTETR